MLLENLGWTGFFAGQQYHGMPARVAFASRERFLLWTEFGELGAVVSGALRRSHSLWPTVGDWVTVRPGSDVIEHVFQRKTLLSRKQPGSAPREQVLAANIDVLFIVTGLDRDFNERRIERYLVVARQAGAAPAILLNKADLAPTLQFDLEEIASRLKRSTGVPVIPVSALTGDGLHLVQNFVAKGETAALIGSSGAGKSTLVNCLLSQNRQSVGDLRPSDQRGRHTTTARSMFLIPCGWLLIDMPGLREVQLWASPAHLNTSFEDIQRIAQNCRFRDCTHSGEPGCAVSQSTIDSERIQNYLKLQRELDYLERKADKRLMSESRARWKIIHKSMRNHPKNQF